jgi:integrase
VQADWPVNFGHYTHFPFPPESVPLEEVSKLLGHESIKTTERHYAKWVKGRQARLHSLVSDEPEANKSPSGSEF